MEDYPQCFVDYCGRHELPINDESWDSWKAMCIHEDQCQDRDPDELPFWMC